MIGIVIVAHGWLAREYLAAVEHVVGPQQGIATISFSEDHDRLAKQNEILQAINSVDTGTGVIVATDIHGGSPANISRLACTFPNRKILAGINLPMLIKLTKCRHIGLDAAIDVAREAGRKYITSLEPNFTETVKPHDS